MRPQKRKAVMSALTEWKMIRADFKSENRCASEIKLRLWRNYISRHWEWTRQSRSTTWPAKLDRNHGIKRDSFCRKVRRKILHLSSLTDSHTQTYAHTHTHRCAHKNDSPVGFPNLECSLGLLWYMISDPRLRTTHRLSHREGNTPSLTLIINVSSTFWEGMRRKRKMRREGGERKKKREREGERVNRNDQWKVKMKRWEEKERRYFVSLSRKCVNERLNVSLSFLLDRWLRW